MRLHSINDFRRLSASAFFSKMTNSKFHNPRTCRARNVLADDLASGTGGNVQIGTDRPFSRSGARKFFHFSQICGKARHRGTFLSHKAELDQVTEDMLPMSNAATTLYETSDLGSDAIGLRVHIDRGIC